MARLPTLDDCIANGHMIAAHCEECGHVRVLNVRELADKLGDNFPIRRLIGRLRCVKCRSKRTEVRIHQGGGVVAGHGPSTRET